MSEVDESRRLENAERQLALVQSFFPRIDSKVSALFAISSGQIAVAALNLTLDDLKLWYVAIPAALFVVAVCAVVWNLYRCTYPHLDGGAQSLVYFAEIAKRTESDYIKRYREVTDKDLTEDLIGQIWRNSEIVAEKYKYLKIATVTAMLSLLPWALLLTATTLTKWQMPTL